MPTPFITLITVTGTNLVTTRIQTYSFSSTNKPNCTNELLETTEKMTKYFKSHISIAHLILMTATTTPVQITTANPTQTDTNTNYATVTTNSMKLLIQHTHPITPFQNLKLVKSTLTQKALITYLIPL